jgi:hypothetical protein
LVSDDDEGAVVAEVGIADEVLDGLEDMAGDGFGRFGEMGLEEVQETF